MASFFSAPAQADGVTLQAVGATLSIKDAGVTADKIAAPVRDFVLFLRAIPGGPDASLGNVTDGDTFFIHAPLASGSDATTATESDAVARIPAPCIVDGFAVYSGDNTLAGVATWTLRKNGADTGMTAATVASTNGSVASTGAAVAYAADDTIGLKIAGPAPVVAGIYRPYVIAMWGRKL